MNYNLNYMIFLNLEWQGTAGQSGRIANSRADAAGSVVSERRRRDAPRGDHGVTSGDHELASAIGSLQEPE